MYTCLRLTVCLYMSTYPILFIDHDVLKRVSAFFSPTLAHPASWHVSVPIVLLFFINFLLLRFSALVRVRA